ncbi:MAG: TonB-dependent receptor [Spongiibacteraceae bacterium]
MKFTSIIGRPGKFHGEKRSASSAIARCFIALNLMVASTLVLGDAPMLEEVVVTAQKRTQSLQDVPVAVTAVTAQDLADAGINDVSDLAAQIPSLVVSTNAGPFNTSYRIRGIGNEGNIPTFEPATGLFIDGAFRSRSGLGLGELVDVQSVEVLKGPQSTLYGKNVTAGVISVSTKAPSNDFELMAEGTYGSDSLTQLKGSLNLPVTDAMAFRFGLVSTQRDTNQRNSLGDDGRDIEQTALRAQFRLDLSDSTTLRLIGSIVDRDMAPAMGDIQYSPSQLSIIGGAGGSVDVNDAYDQRVQYPKNLHFTQESSDATAILEFAGEQISITSVTGYEDYDVALNFNNVGQLPFEVIRFFDSQEGSSISQEFRISSNDGDVFNWITGAFYFENDYQRGGSEGGEFELLNHVEEFGGAVAKELVGLPQLLPLDTPILGVEGDKGFFIGKQDSKALGAFAHFSLSLSESLEMVAGIRYSLEEKSGRFDSRNELSILGCVPPTNQNLICVVAPSGLRYDGSGEWDAVTGTLSASYSPTPGTLFYATYATGFKGGGFNLEFGDAPESTRSYNPEDVTNIELGWKTELLDRRVRFNGAVFQTTYEDYQNATFVGLQFTVNNAERVVVEGLELESTILLSRSLTATVAATYLDPIYERYAGGSCYYGRPADNPAVGQCDLSGERLPFAPEWSGSVILHWETPLWKGDFYARTEYQYTGDNNPSSELNPIHQRDPYSLINARVGWRNASFDVVLWGKNLGDETWLIQAGPANIATTIESAVGANEASYQTFLGEPRSVGMTMRLYY